MKLLAKTQPREHSSGEGLWWIEYRVRRMDDAECAETWARIGVGEFRGSWVLETRYDHDAKSAEYCTHHTGEWRAWNHAESESKAVASCVGDSHYYKAESLDPLHADMVAKIEAERAKVEAEKALKERRAEIVAECKQWASAEYVSALKASKLYRKARRGEAPQEAIDAIKADVMARYETRLAENLKAI